MSRYPSHDVTVIRAHVANIIFPMVLFISMYIYIIRCNISECETNEHFHSLAVQIVGTSFNLHGRQPENISEVKSTSEIAQIELSTYLVVEFIA